MAYELMSFALPDDASLTDGSVGGDAVLVEEVAISDIAMEVFSVAASEPETPTGDATPTEAWSTPTCSVLPPVDSPLAPGSSGDPM